MGRAHGQAPPEAAQHAGKEKKREMKSIEHAAFRAREDRFLYQASQRKKSGCLSLPRLATRRSRHWSQICAPLFWKSRIRDHAVMEEKKEIESNYVATSNLIRDHAVKEAHGQ
jgi:hypothetical protein